MFSALRKSLLSQPSFAELQANVLAGLTVGIIALPLSMALAIAVGVAPEHGLYTAIVAGIVIALTGGSKVNISGPTAAFVVVLLPIVLQFGIAGLLTSGFMAGVILILMGAGRLGKLIEIVPYPVTIGFTAGIGVVIATLQIKDFLGLDIDFSQGEFLDKARLTFYSLPSANWQESLIGGLTLAILVVWPKLRSKIPGHLVALLSGSVIAWLLHIGLDGFDVSTIGNRFTYEIDGVQGFGIPPVLPQFEWPWNLPDAEGKPLQLSFSLIKQLLPAAMTIAILGALESLLCAVVADGMSGKKHQPNDELIGQGIGNMLCPLFGGIPATAAIARTVANIKAGGSMPLSSMIHALFILGAILMFSPLLAYIPMASMAALLLVVAWNMSEARHFVRTLKVAPKDDSTVLIICFLLTVLIDMTVAVAVGMSLAGVLFIRKSIDLTHAVALDNDHDAYGKLPDGISLYDVNGPLFFGSAQKALKSVLMVTPNVRVVILDMTEVSMLDMSAIVLMESIVKHLTDKKITLVINRLQPRMIAKLTRAGIGQQSDRILFSKDLVEALVIAKEKLV